MHHDDVEVGKIYLAPIYGRRKPVRVLRIWQTHRGSGQKVFCDVLDEATGHTWVRSCIRLREIEDLA